MPTFIFMSADWVPSFHIYIKKASSAFEKLAVMGISSLKNKLSLNVLNSSFLMKTDKIDVHDQRAILLLWQKRIQTLFEPN